jgi:hypothetical protein
MEIEIPLPADEQLTPEDEGLPISIRKLDRLETTNRSNSQGA